MKKIYRLIPVLFLIPAGLTPAQSQVVIDGINLKVEAGTEVYLHDLGLNNQTNGTDGSIDNEGNIYVDGDWNNNATGGSVFINQNATGTVHFTGTAAQAAGGTRTTSFENLTINNTSATGVTLGQPVTVTQALTLTDGILYTDATNLLTVDPGGSANEGNAGSFVDGPIEKVGNTAFVFPTGDGTVWAPVEINNLVGAAVTDVYEAEYFDSPAPFPTNLPPSGIANVSAIEYWHIDHTGSATSTDVSLYWKDADRSDIQDISSGDLLAVHYNSTSGEWETKGLTVCPGSTIGPGGSGCVTGTFDSFSPITLGSQNGTNPLPVSLLSFEAAFEGGKVHLDWATASESNNDFFTVERSADGKIFEPVATVNGAGTSTSTLTYAAVDSWPLTHTSYYRLKQTDFDGKYTYSKTVKVDNLQNAYQLDVFPNPARQEFSVLVQGAEDEKAELMILDMMGRAVHSQMIYTGTLERIDAAELRLDAGTYMLQIIGNTPGLQQRLIINP